MELPIEHDFAECNELTDRIADVMDGRDMRHVIMVLSKLLPMSWCGWRKFRTTTDAIDGWRQLNKQMEETIRINFGRVRYGEGE